MDHFLVVQRNDINDPVASSCIAGLYLSMKKYEEALIEYRNLLRIDAKYKDGRFGCAFALICVSQNPKTKEDAVAAMKKEAEELLRQVVAVDPLKQQAHFYLAGLYYDGGKSDKAEKHYRESIRLSPTDVLSRYNLSIILQVSSP